jgi:hypothetical protein
MRMFLGAIILSTVCLVGAQAQENLDNPPGEPLNTVPLSELLDDSYEIKTTVVNMLILQKKKSVYACNLVARTLADVQNWTSAACVDISPQ